MIGPSTIRAGLAALDLSARSQRVEQNPDLVEMRERADVEDAVAARAELEAEYALDDRQPPLLFRRPDGAPVPWAHRGVASDRTTHQAEEAAA